LIEHAVPIPGRQSVRDEIALEKQWFGELTRAAKKKRTGADR
jgi:hypothetical protein